MYRGYYWWDQTYILIIIGFLICSGASARFHSTVRRYSAVYPYCGMTGAQVAQRILSHAGIYDVQIGRVRGSWSDHYNSGTKMLNLSDTVYGSTSLAAVCVAAHECGHAIQDHKNYVPLRVRHLLHPIASFGSQLSWPLFFIGLIMSMEPLIQLGILLFSAAVLLQLVTLPVETNASRRALAVLRETRILDETELRGGRKVLKAAALTYLAALAQSILQLVRLLALAGGRRRRDD